MQTLNIHNDSQGIRLDGSDLYWLRRELEFVDKEQYGELFPENKARQILPSQTGVPDWANTYSSSLLSSIGEAEIIGSNSTDLPRVDVTRTELPQMIKDLGIAYGYTYKEIKRAIATGMHLDIDRASAARRTIETQTDKILAVGLTTHGLTGALKTAATVTTAITKTGGGTGWTQAAKPDEVAGDFFKLGSAIYAALKNAGGQLFESYRFTIPPDAYAYAAQRRMGDGSDQKILQFVESSPLVESVWGWQRCHGTAANNTDDRMMAFVPSRMVIASLVPQEFTPMNPIDKGLEWLINCVGSVGGVYLRYLVAMGYMDAIDVA